MHGPGELIKHLQTHLYHPRSDAHSNAICRGILYDLLDHCELFARKAAAGRIVARLNHTATVSHQTWKVDLAVGPPPGSPRPPESGERITFATPAVVELALEAKSVMTEHGKARLNRLRDLQAFHLHAHDYDPRVVAMGVVVVNVSPVFWSPTRPATDITNHRNIGSLGASTVDTYRNLPIRNKPTDSAGLEGVGVLVISHDNIRKNASLPPGAPVPSETALVTKPPAPPVGDPLHYATMLHRACAAYTDRWP